MPKNKKPQSDSDSDSSFDTNVVDRNPPKKAKTDGETSAIKENGEVMWNLSGNKMLKLRSFKGKTYIDIREYYDKDGKLLPTKKGVSLTPQIYQKLKSLIGEIDIELEKM